MSNLLTQHAIHDIIMNVFDDFDKDTETEIINAYVKSEWETDPPIPGISPVKIDIIKSKLLIGINNIKQCHDSLDWQVPSADIFNKNSCGEYIAIYAYVELDLRQLMEQYVEMGSTPCEVILNLVDDGISDSAMLSIAREYIKDNYHGMCNVHVRSTGGIIFADKIPVDNNIDSMIALDNMDLQQFQDEQS